MCGPWHRGAEAPRREVELELAGLRWVYRLAGDGMMVGCIDIGGGGMLNERIDVGGGGLLLELVE